MTMVYNFISEIIRVNLVTSPDLTQVWYFTSNSTTYESYCKIFHGCFIPHKSFMH